MRWNKILMSPPRFTNHLNGLLSLLLFFLLLLPSTTLLAASSLRRKSPEIAVFRPPFRPRYISRSLSFRCLPPPPRFLGQLKLLPSAFLMRASFKTKKISSGSSTLPPGASPPSLSSRKKLEPKPSPTHAFFSPLCFFPSPFPFPPSASTPTEANEGKSVSFLPLGLFRFPRPRSLLEVSACSPRPLA